MDHAAANARDLELELAWLAQLIDTRFKLYFGQDCPFGDIQAVAPPDLAGSDSPYAQCIRQHGLGFAERGALALVLASHIRPQLLDVFFLKNQMFDRRFSEFGGIHSGQETGFTPTGETLLFLLAADDLARRFALHALFEAGHVFARQHILRLQPQNNEPLLQAPLRLSEEHLALFTSGNPHRPEFGAQFPAQLIETRLNWDDLVLHPGTRKQVGEIETWIRHGQTLLEDWGMGAKLRPGYRACSTARPAPAKP